jgi:hypothetical protein
MHGILHTSSIDNCCRKVSYYAHTKNECIARSFLELLILDLVPKTQGRVRILPRRIDASVYQDCRRTLVFSFSEQETPSFLNE